MLKECNTSKPDIASDGGKRRSAMIAKPDIFDVIRAEGIELKQKGRNFWACCPFHSEQTASFQIDTERQSYHCFGCQAHGDSISFVQRYKGLSFREALSYLNIDTGVKPSLEALRAMKKQRERAEIVRRFRAWARDYHSELCDFYRGLQERKAQVKTEAELDRISWLYHLETLWMHRLDILESGDDEHKFFLYREVTKNENTRV